MGKIQVSGRVQYMPGPWGAARAAAGATVEVIDVDPGGGDDVIWAGSTDTQGRFSGMSQEWQDHRSFQVWVQESLFPPHGHWETRSEPDPTDLLLLKLRVKCDGRVHEVFPFLNAGALPVALPWPAPYVARAGRALLVVNNTVEIGRPEYRGLYQFLEASGDAVAHAVCGPHYQLVRSLNGRDATLGAWVATLRALAQAPGIQAVDTILNMHGSPGVLWFSGAAGGVAMDMLGTALQGAALGPKLRLVYNTSCYGHSHSPTLDQKGYDTMIGARKVVAASATEYPAFLTGWVGGLSVADALAPAQAPALREPLDRFARERLGFADTDSYKVITGNAGLTIGTPAVN